MLDLLAAIVSADPPALLAWLVLAFAAGMYPVGIMLGSSCSPCCNSNSNPCSQCTAGELPDTLTVTFSGLADRTQGPDLCALTFSAPYGSGAAGKVTAPGGDPVTNKGPITAVSLTNGGSGYAKLGRVAPTITASGGSGTGATFSVTTTSTNDANGIPSWSVTGVTFTGTTSGYGDGDQIAFDVATGDTAEQGAAATIHTVRTAPTVTASVPDGTGATLSVTTAASGTTPQTWSVTGVTVANGGTGYPAGGTIAFEIAEGDTEISAAYAEFRCSRLQPTVSLSVNGSGSGAALQPTLAYYAPGDFWYVSGVTIPNGGSGYAAGDPVAITLVDGDSDGVPFSMTVNVDGGGSVTGVTVDNPFPHYAPWNRGSYYVNTGIIQGVTLSSGGIYYRDSDEIASISVEAGGTYYREDASASPYVATVTVGVSQTAPSNGTGATLTATVESSTSSANFGKVTGVSSSGGSGYLAHELFDTCMTRFDGRSIVVKREAGNPCLYAFSCEWDRECGLERELVYVQYRGPAQPLTVEMGLLHPTGGRADGQRIWILVENPSMTADELSPDCSAIDVMATGGSGVPEGATAHVVAGGEYEETKTCARITQQDIEPSQVTINWAGKTWIAFAGGGEKPCDLGDISFSASYCGIDSGVAASGTAGSGGLWADELLPDPSAPNGCGSFGQEWAANVSVVLNNTCDRYWNGSVTVRHRYYWRSWFVGTGAPVGIRDCVWTYQIVDVPIDENGLPSGQITLGAPQFSQADNFGSNFPLFPDQEVYPYYPPPCSNPGTPTIAINVMP